MIKLMAKKKQITPLLPLTLARTTRTVYFFAAFYALTIIIFDSGNLITRDAVINRWTLLSGLVVINSIVWLISAQTKNKSTIPSSQILLRTTLALTLLILAGLSTYWERGMASTSTIFYVLPLLVIATLKNRHALIATATLAAATYAYAAVRYFNDFFNEGLRIQLWGSILLYGGTIFVCGWLIMVITDLRKDSV